MRLTYLDQVCSEVLRLYAPAWAGSRRVLAPARLGGYAIPAGSLVMFSPYLTHRHPAFWDHPERFDPGRFGQEPPAPGSYFPFGMGPRSCVGRHLALIELKLLLASILSSVRLERTSNEPIAIDSRVVVLRPKGEVQMNVRRRDEFRDLLPRV